MGRRTFQQKCDMTGTAGKKATVKIVLENVTDKSGKIISYELKGLVAFGSADEK